MTILLDCNFLSQSSMTALADPQLLILDQCPAQNSHSVNMWLLIYLSYLQMSWRNMGMSKGLNSVFRLEMFKKVLFSPVFLKNCNRDNNRVEIIVWGKSKRFFFSSEQFCIISWHYRTCSWPPTELLYYSWEGVLFRDSDWMPLHRVMFFFRV